MGLLFVFGALRTLGAPLRATPTNAGAGVPVDAGPTVARAATVATTAVAAAVVAGTVAVAGAWVLLSSFVIASIGLPSPGFGSNWRTTRKATTVATIPSMIHRPRPQCVLASNMSFCSCRGRDWIRFTRVASCSASSSSACARRKGVFKRFPHRAQHPEPIERLEHCAHPVVLDFGSRILRALSHRFEKGPLGGIEARVDVTNVFDRIYEIRDGTGVGVGAPQFGPRRGVFGGLSKAF